MMQVRIQIRIQGTGVVWCAPCAWLLSMWILIQI